MMAKNLNQGSNSLITASDKKQSNGFLCFSCLGKGRPPSSLIPDELSLIHNINEKDNEHCTEHQETSDVLSPYGKDSENDNNKHGKIPDNNEANENDNNIINQLDPTPLNNENVELDLTNSEKHGDPATPVTATNTTSPSHLSLSQAPTNTISSQLSSHRFPSTGLSSPPPPLKCGFLVR